MQDRTKAKLFVSGERGCILSDGYRAYHSFNRGAYRQAHKDPFGNLRVLSEHTLGGGQVKVMDVEENCCVLLLPVVGCILCHHSNGAVQAVTAGSLQIYPLPGAHQLEVENPYEAELVQFLELQFVLPVGACGQPFSGDFRLDEARNRFVSLYPFSAGGKEGRTSVWIGKFGGRQDAMHRLSGANRGLYAYVLEGAFEVQFRLLEAGDGLALWDADSIELEALSEDAIMLLVETDLPS